MENAQENLIKNWLEHIKRLGKQRGSNAPKVTLDTTRRQLRWIYDHATTDMVVLPQPPQEVADDEVFQSMVLGSAVAQLATAFTKNEEDVEKRRAEDRKARRTNYANRRKAMGLPYKSWAANAYDRERKMVKCGCGCGTVSPWRFVLGHHARWIGWMRRIEQGVMPRESLPEELQTSIKWTRCRGCMGFIPTINHKGEPMAEKLGYACQYDRAKKSLRAAKEAEARKELECRIPQEEIDAKIKEYYSEKEES